MAINRAPFNALVDDNGTGTTGSPWNKAQIAGVILDPVDAAIAAAIAGLPPIPPAGPVTALGSSSGQTTQATTENLAYVNLPLLTVRDALIVSVIGSSSAGTAPILMELAQYNPVSTAIVTALTLTGAAGGGDLIPNNVGMFRVVLRPIPPGANVEALGSGAITAGLTQARGFSYAALSLGNLVTAGAVIYLRQFGVSAGGTLFWSWTVHLLKG